MSRPARIALIIGASIVGLILLIVIAALIVVHTGWFHNFVREKIIAAVEENTGGRAEIGQFNLSLGALRAEVDNFVMHGTEGPNQPPLLRADKVIVGLKIVSVLKHKINLDLLRIDRPQVFVEVKPDGTTNLPTPRVQKPKSNTNPLQTVMDLEVGHVIIDNGLLQFADRKTPFSVEGDHLTAKMLYHALTPSYTGTITMSPVWVQKGSGPRLPVNTDMAFTITNQRIDLNSANFRTPDSLLHVTAAVTDLNNASGSVRANGRINLAEMGRTFGMKTSRSMKNAPPLDLNLTAAVDRNTLHIKGLQASLGASRFNAAGTINDKTMAGAIRFNGDVTLAQLGRILDLSSRPAGRVTLTGDAKLNGTSNYDVTARVEARDVSLQNGNRRIQGINASTDLAATPARIDVRNLRLAAFGGTLTGAAEVLGMDRFRVDATLHGFDTRYLAKTYGSRNLAWDGIISGPVHVAGRLRAPSVARSVVATTQLGIRPGPNGVPLSGLLAVNYDGPRDTVNFGNSYVQLPSTRLGFSGTLGTQLQIALVSHNLNDLLPAIAMASSNPPAKLPVQLVNGAASFNGTVTGSLSDPAIAGRLQMTNFEANGQRFNLLATDINARKTGASLQNAVLNGPAAQANLNASVGLSNWKPEDNQPVAANASVRSPNVQTLLAAAGRPDTPLSGALNISAKVAGTIGDPRGTADLAITNGTAGTEPFNRIQAHANVGGQLVELTNAEVVLPAGQVNLNASFQHPPKSFETGNLRFQLKSTPIVIQKLRTVEERKPGLEGTVRLQANGAATLLAPAPNRSRIQIADLNADVNAHALEVNTKQAGNLTLTANTRGQDLTFQLHSDVANSNINGSGRMLLAGDYPLQANIAFSPVRLAPVMRLASSQPTMRPQPWDGVVEGTITVAGPVMRTDQLKGKLDLSTLRVFATAPQGQRMPGGRRALEVHNAGPVVVTLDSQAVNIQSAHLAGTDTNFSVTGGLTLRQPATADIHANGNIGLDLAQTFDPNIFADGSLVVAAAVQGPLSQPAIHGRLQLVNASVNYLSSPNGLDHANGVILFNGSQAVIQNLTGQSGGGNVSLGGTVRYGGPQMDFRLRANAKEVRVRSGNASVQVNAGIDFAGSTDNSILQGDVTILQVALHSHSDIGSMLSQAGGPPSTPGPTSPMLAGMRLDVRIDTSPSVQFLTSLTQNLQADAHVQVRGSAASPGMLGRATITQGDVVFFGSKYTIDQGTISFYNPTRIEPVLNVDLSTKAQGVDVTLSVTGPIDNMKLTYHSDPPMQFSDLVRLLATGKVPTSDPVLAASQPPAPEQNWEQTGASAVLGQAVANPVAGRLQRLFGVTQLKIDPQIVGGGATTAQARMTLMQQINPDLTFTYITDVRNSNPQVIRIEWSIDPTWSAVALRQENGQFGVDVFYKKRFW